MFDPDEQHAQEARWRGVMRKCVACAAQDQAAADHRAMPRHDSFGLHPVAEPADQPPSG